MSEQNHAGSDRMAVRAIRELGEELLRRRQETEDGICFGRIDREAGRPLYIGREPIQDQGETLHPVVISWRADAATPYYEATAADPLGIVRRRHFELDETTVVSIDDEALAALPAHLRSATIADEVAPSSAPAGLPPLRDSLLRELERARSAEMRDIVPTIQRDQHQMIRAERDGVLVIQGGPGTGKTAVALHRAAWLAYNTRDLGGSGGVLVVGPNQAFMQ